VTANGAAYDDGSGTIITLCLARALAKYEWNATLVFAAWDQEEAGLVGSTYYAEKLKDTAAQVVLYVNFDMTGINWPAKFGGATDVPLKADFGGEGDKTMGSLWSAVFQHLKFPGSATVVATGATSGPSDHGAFLAAKYPASWVRGALIGNYPMYHNGDSVESMVAIVGGQRGDLVKGFDTVLQSVFLFAFLLDQQAIA
jgi:Zn-dependent M28 family amino/carboxypeptidase